MSQLTANTQLTIESVVNSIYNTVRKYVKQYNNEHAEFAVDRDDSIVIAIILDQSSWINTYSPADISVNHLVFAAYISMYMFIKIYRCLDVKIDADNNCIAFNRINGEFIKHINEYTYKDHKYFLDNYWVNINKCQYLMIMLSNTTDLQLIKLACDAASSDDIKMVLYGKHVLKNKSFDVIKYLVETHGLKITLGNIVYAKHLNTITDRECINYVLNRLVLTEIHTDYSASVNCDFSMLIAERLIELKREVNSNIRLSITYM